jgi:hypothetical protein
MIFFQRSMIAGIGSFDKNRIVFAFLLSLTRKSTKRLRKDSFAKLSNLAFLTGLNFLHARFSTKKLPGSL